MQTKHRQRQGRDFIHPNNHLRGAEMALEQNANMLDGVLNNGVERAADYDERHKESILKRMEEFKAEDARRCRACGRAGTAGALPVGNPGKRAKGGSYGI